MDTHEKDEVNARLDRLEREMRRWRLGALVAGGLLGLVGLVGAAKPNTVPVADEIRARRFVLVDKAGREQAYLGMTVIGDIVPELEPELCLGDREKSGTCVYPFGLSTRASNGGFVNLNPIGLRMALENVLVEINAGFGRAGPRLTLSGSSPSVVLSEDGQNRAVLGWLFEIKRGTTGSQQIIYQRPASSLVLFDKDGKVLVEAP